jgi:hypothetical protein
VQANANTAQIASNGQTIQLSMSTNSGAEYVWFSTDNLVRLKISSQNINEKGGKDD